MSDRIGITRNFTLTPAEIAEVVAGGFAAAEDVRIYRFFTNAFGTSSQGVDVVSTWTPLALRGNTAISAVFNHTVTEGRTTPGVARQPAARRVRLRAAAHALERRHHATCRSREPRRPPQLLRRLVRLRQRARNRLRPSGGLEHGFFDGRPIVRSGAERAARGGNDAGRRGHRTPSTPTRRSPSSPKRSASGTASTCRGATAGPTTTWRIATAGAPRTRRLSHRPRASALRPPLIVEAHVVEPAAEAERREGGYRLPSLPGLGFSSG